MKAKDIAEDGLAAALLIVAQVGLAWIPNVELVSLLLIIYTLLRKRQVYLILAVFVILEGILYGFGLWWFSYLYTWPILCLSINLISRKKVPGALTLAILSGMFGLLFGLLSALSYLVTGGPGAALSWWVAGIPFDIIHGISNFIITLILFRPLYCLLSNMHQN